MHETELQMGVGARMHARAHTHTTKEDYEGESVATEKIKKKIGKHQNASWPEAA